MAAFSIVLFLVKWNEVISTSASAFSTSASAFPASTILLGSAGMKK